MTKSAAVVRNAKRLRRQMTPPEVYMWQHLRQLRLHIKFRRQHPLGPFILDFYCPAAKLAIEIDGIVHDMGTQPEQDLRRDAYIRGIGIEVVRISASEVLKNSSDIADRVIRLALARIGK